MTTGDPMCPICGRMLIWGKPCKCREEYESMKSEILRLRIENGDYNFEYPPRVRWLIRNGERILQERIEVEGRYEMHFEWKDVPVEVYDPLTQDTMKFGSEDI